MKTIRFIHTNDIHSAYDSFLKIASVINEKITPDSLVLDSGDFNDFSNEMTFGTHGIGGLKLLNHLHYLALTIGNNEGFQPLSIIKENVDSQLISFLSCNLLKKDGCAIDGIKPYMIKEVNNERFLIIGVSPFHSSYNLYYQHYDIKAFEPIPIILNILKQEKENYDFVILLSHLGLKTEILLTQAINQIDMILSGHSHHALKCIKVNQTLIHQSGVRGSHVGIIDLVIKDHHIVDYNGENIEINHQEKDEQTSQIYQQMVNQAHKNLQKEVCTIPKDLIYKTNAECNLTNLLADYLFHHYDCDFSLINSGLTEKNLYKGKISMMDILKTSNSPLNIATFEIQGKYLLKALKESLDINKCLDSHRHPGYRGNFLGFLHVSYNCKIKVFNGQIIISCNQQLIEDEKYYKIVTTDYFLRGMGYTSLKNNLNGVIYKETLKEALLNALKEEKSYKNNDVYRWGK